MNTVEMKNSTEGEKVQRLDQSDFYVLELFLLSSSLDITYETSSDSHKVQSDIETQTDKDSSKTN